MPSDPLFHIARSVLSHERAARLVIGCDTMAQSEKVYWLMRFPSMSQDEVDRLCFIIEEERRRLGQISKDFADFLIPKPHA